MRRSVLSNVDASADSLDKDAASAPLAEEALGGGALLSAATVLGGLLLAMGAWQLLSMLEDG